MWLLGVYLSIPVLTTLSYLTYKGYQESRYGKYISLNEVMDCADNEEAVYVFGARNLFWPVLLALVIIYGVGMTAQYLLQSPGKVVGYLGRRKDLKKQEHQKWLDKPVKDLLDA
jgi:hypothetical protein